VAGPFRAGTERTGMARRVWDVVWRREEVSHGRYLLWGATLSLTLSAVAAALYWLVVTTILELRGLPAPPDGVPHIAEILIGWVVLAPVGETIVLACCVGIARAFTDREAWHVAAGATPLGLLHAIEGVTAVDAGGHAFVSVVGFVLFALAYVAWRRSSLSEAFWMCAGIHMIHNGVVGLALLADHARASGHGT
jgi:hypothetical protein